MRELRWRRESERVLYRLSKSDLSFLNLRLQFVLSTLAEICLSVSTTIGLMLATSCLAPI
jgi:hypothetical protein